MFSYVFNVGFNRNSSKKAEFNEKLRFLKHLKKPEVRSMYIGSYPISACAIYTTSALREDQTKPQGVSFSLFLLLLFCFSLILSLLVPVFILHLAKQRKSIQNMSEFASY